MWYGQTDRMSRINKSQTVIVWPDTDVTPFPNCISTIYTTGEYINSTTSWEMVSEWVSKFESQLVLVILKPGKTVCKWVTLWVNQCACFSLLDFRTKINLCNNIIWFNMYGWRLIWWREVYNWTIVFIRICRCIELLVISPKHNYPLTHIHTQLQTHTHTYISL